MTEPTRPVEVDEARIDAIFAAFDQVALPGAAVGIAVAGKPVYRKGFGLANMELPVVLSPTIRMRIGSITKHFASLAYLLLCEEGRAGLDDPVARYLPELHPTAHGVTMRQLMGNVGGLRDVFDIAWQFSGTEQLVGSDALLDLYRTIDDVNAPPGMAWIYNNGGYLLLSYAIERIAGERLEEVFRQRIFEPIGMYQSLLHRDDGDFVPNNAAAHMTNGDGGFRKSYFFGTAFAGEGGIVSTVDDMLRWLAHMDAPLVGTPSSWDAIKTPLRLANGQTTGYGLGLYPGAYRGIATISHGGGGMGANAQMLKVPSAGLDIIVMVNRGDAWAALLVDQILDACLPDLDPLPEPGMSAPAAGLFQSRETGRVILLSAQDGQQIAAINGTDLPVAPDPEGVLRPTGLARNTKRAIRLDGDTSRPAAIAYDDYGNIDRLVAVEPDATPTIDIAGRYVSSAARTTAEIRKTGEDWQLVTRGAFGEVRFRLERLAGHICRARSTSYQYFGGILLFEADGGAFRFSSDRTRGLLFERAAP